MSFRLQPADELIYFLFEQPLNEILNVRSGPAFQRFIRLIDGISSRVVCWFADLQEVNAKLWDELLAIILKPERLDELVRSEPIDASLERELERLDSQIKTITQKVQRLLTLYEDGDLDKATYLSRRDQHEKHLHQIRVVAERTRGLLQKEDQRDNTTALQHTLRILGRSQSRFTTDQKARVFRSMVREARLGDDSLTLELYTEPIENVWYKYRQNPDPQRRDLNLKVARTIADLEGTEDRRLGGKTIYPKRFIPLLSPKHTAQMIRTYGQKRFFADTHHA